MTRRILTLLGCLVLPVACGTETPDPEAAATTEAAGPSVLALHLYNPAAEEAHQQILSGLSELNGAIAQAGHPETQYRVWKISGEQTGAYTHLFGSLWADQATYDAVHEHDAYTAVMSGLEPIQEEVYNRYVALSPRVDDPSPMPEDGPGFLTLHLFNLDSPESEDAVLAMLEDFNTTVASAGHPETRYGLWKVTGEQTGDFTYLFGSLWADRGTYDAVHDNPDFQAVQERHGDTYTAFFGDQVYNQYDRVMLN